MRRAATIIAAICALSTSAATFKVYLWLGQSNMGGKSFNDCQCRVTYGVQTNVYFYGASSNVMPLTVTNSLDGWYNFGPEVSAGPGFILKDGGPVGFVKVAAGGTQIGSNWLSSGAAASVGWGETTNRIAKAMIAYSNAGHTVSGFGGMVWYQGETDSMYQSLATNYFAKLTQFVAQVRTYTATPTLPVCIIRIAPSVDWTYYGSVTDAQAQAAATLTNCIIVTPQVQGMYDVEHLDSYSLMRLGQQVYESWIGVLP